MATIEGRIIDTFENLKKEKYTIRNGQSKVIKHFDEALVSVICHPTEVKGLLNIVMERDHLMPAGATLFDEANPDGLDLDISQSIVFKDKQTVEVHHPTSTDIVRIKFIDEENQPKKPPSMIIEIDRNTNLPEYISTRKVKDLVRV